MTLQIVTFLCHFLSSVSCSYRPPQSVTGRVRVPEHSPPPSLSLNFTSNRHWSVTQSPRLEHRILCAIEWLLLSTQMWSIYNCGLPFEDVLVKSYSCLSSSSHSCVFICTIRRVIDGRSPFPMYSVSTTKIRS